MQQQGWPFLNPWTGTVQIWPYNGPRLPTPQQPSPSQQQLHPPQQQHALHAAAFQPMFPGPVTAAALPMPFQLSPGAFPGMPPSAYIGPPAPGFGVPSFPLMPSQPSTFQQQQPPVPWTPMSSTGSWDQHALTNSFNTMTLTPPPTGEWYMDSGATSHMTFNPGNLLISRLPNSSAPSNIIIVLTGSTSIPAICRLLHLWNILVTPQLVKKLISVCQFTIDNN
jgi:hypothetical protein